MIKVVDEVAAQERQKEERELEAEKIQEDFREQNERKVLEEQQRVAKYEDNGK